MRGEDEEEGSEMTDKSDLAARAFWPCQLCPPILVVILATNIILVIILATNIILVIIFPYYYYPGRYLGYSYYPAQNFDSQK